MKHKKPLSLLLAVLMALSLIPAIAAAETTEILDSLTAAAFTATDTTYTNFASVSITSDAVYAGNSAKTSDEAIQLRSKDNSGIVTTVSGGKATKIAVEWNENTTSGRTLDIYGKNSAYSSAADLYNSSTQGTKLGSIVMGTSTDLVISGDYEYIGLRSNSGAMYITEIDIAWKADSDTPPAPTYTVSFDANGGTGTMANVTTVSPYTLPACGFTAPEGKEFDYWAVDGDSTHYAPSDTYELTGNTTFIAQWKDLPVVNYTDMMLKRVPANGDTVVIYYPKASKVMTAESYYYNNKKYELAAADATLTDNILAVPDEAVRLTVSVADGKYTFATADGKYLEADGTNVQLVSAQSANTLFQLETAAAGTDNYYIKCDSATFNGSAQYIEYYGGYFTVYSLNTSNTPIFTFQFFSEDGEGSTPETTYTVTLYPGEAEGEPQTIEDVTSPYTLPDCPFEAPEGCVFDGWQADNGDVYAAGTEVVLEEPNTVFFATWKELVARTYELVTSEDGLVDGGTYLIASDLFADELYLMSNQTSNNRAQYKVSGVEGTTLTLDETWIATAAADALAFEFTLEDAEVGWAFHDEVTGGYLYAAGNETNKKNWLRTETELDDNGIFIIAYEGDDGATVPVAQGENTRGYMHYNGENNLFSCYAADSHITGAVYLYKLVEDVPATLDNGFYLIGPDWTINDISAANKFGENLNVGGEMLLATTLAVGDQIKVIKVENNAITAWYPDGLGNQYTVDAAHAGDVTIYFRQTYTSDWAAFGGYFYIQADYAITCVSGDHGLISTMAGRASAGTTVTIYIEPEEDYELDTLTVMQGETEIPTTRVNDETYTFVMPAGDVTITATFAIPATAPYFKSQSLTLDGLIGVNFVMELPELTGVNYETSYMTFNVSGVTQTVNYTAAKSRSGETKGFTCQIRAIEMAQPITATFHYTQNGTEKTVEKTYTVEEYFAAFDAKLEGNPTAFDTTTITLVHALADYGYYTQHFLQAQRGWTFGEDYAEMSKHYTNNYDISANALEEYAIERTHDDEDLKEKIGFAVKLDSATTICLYYTPVAGYTGSVTSETYEVTPDGSRYVVTIPNIAAHMLSNTYEVVVTTQNGDATVRASVLSYVKLLLEAYTDNETAQNAAAAIYAYSQAADAFIAAHTN